MPVPEGIPKKVASFVSGHAQDDRMREIVQKDACNRRMNPTVVNTSTYMRSADPNVDNVVRTSCRVMAVMRYGITDATAVWSPGSKGRKNNGGTHSAPSTKKKRTSRLPAYVCSSNARGSSKDPMTDPVKLSIWI